MIRAAVLVAALGLCASAIAGVIYLKTATPPGDNHYLGSSACERCHRPEFGVWHESQHTKMMRPVANPGVLVADFSPGVAPFKADAAYWAIGGKWEQQFMARDASGETLLPGAWEVSSHRWDRVSWDGWNKPIPNERCNGCHTVGLDPVTGIFVEPNIGCEACHGPGEWHAKTLGLGLIESLPDAEVCGQCHSRGTDPSGHFHFPLGYKPGGTLKTHFDLESGSPGQNSSDWWGNGRARSRHEEFPDWSTGGHANSLRVLREGYDGRYGPVVDDCLRCHSGDYILADGRKPRVAEARVGITCSVCHNVHGDLDQARVGCADCHESGAYYHEPVRNTDHVPCPASANVSCVDCHMPKVIQIGGEYQFHSHASGILEPKEAARWGMPSSCSQGGCHAGIDFTELQTKFDRFYRPNEAGAAQ